MQNLIEFINTAEQQGVVRFITALMIIFVFWVMSSGIAFMLIKTVKLKEKDSERIKKSSFYSPLNIFLKILGIYLAILFFLQIYNVSAEIKQHLTTGFRVLVTIIFARGLAKCFNENGTIAKGIKSKSTKKVDKKMLATALKIVRGVIYLCGAILVITELGFNLNGLIAGFGLGGVIITLAAQDTAKNLFGGLTILLDKPFAVGDWIAVDKFEGTVEEITFRTTRIRTFENSVVNIPNSVIASASIENWSKMEQRRYRTRLYLDINTPLDKVETLMKRIKTVLLKHEEIDDDTILISFEEIVDNGIEVMVSSYTDSIDYKTYLKEREQINYKIMQIVREEGIKLAENSQIVHIKN